MRSLPSVLTAALVVFLAAGCQSKTATPSETTVGNKTTEAPAGTEVAKRSNALVRVVNARNDQVDIYFGDMKAFTGVGEHSVSNYSELPAERHDLKVVEAGHDTSSPIATNSEGLSSGAHYTVVAYRDKNGKAGLTVLEDDLTKANDGKARVRIVNMAPGTDEVDVYPAGQKDSLVKGVNFNSATGYKEVDPAVKDLEVHKKGQNAVAARVSNLDLTSGKTYTIFVMDGGNKLQVVPVEDQLAG